MEVRRITHRSAVNERQLYLASIGDVDDWPDALPLPLKPFVGFMAIDVRPLTNDRLRTFARKLLLQRCVYTCCWGPDADRLDTAFDLELSEPDPTPSRELPYGMGVMTESDEGDSLAEALWAAVYSAYPEHGDGDVVLAISQPAWAEQIAWRFANSRQLFELPDLFEDEDEGS